MSASRNLAWARVPVPPVAQPLLAVKENSRGGSVCVAKPHTGKSACATSSTATPGCERKIAQAGVPVLPEKH